MGRSCIDSMLNSPGIVWTSNLVAICSFIFIQGTDVHVSSCSAAAAAAAAVAKSQRGFCMSHQTVLGLPFFACLMAYGNDAMYIFNVMPSINIVIQHIPMHAGIGLQS